MFAKKKFFSSLQFWPESKLVVLRMFLVIVFFSVISVLVTSRLILSARIYIPGFYWISQTIVYKFEPVLDKLPGPFDYSDFFFFIISLGINVPLIVGAYFLIGKKYAVFSGLAIFIWTFLGVIFSLKIIKDWQVFDYLDFKVDSQGVKRTEHVNYYVIALFAGCFTGFASSFIWKQNISLGGLDFIFTYFAIKKRKEIQKVILPLVLAITSISILVNEGTKTTFSLPVFAYFLFNSVLFSYTRAFVINYLYPKYQIINVLIITQKPKAVRQELNSFYHHGGSLIQGQGLYDHKDKQIIITAMNYLEKNIVIARLKKVDPNAFFIGLPVSFLEGSFSYFHN